MVNKSSIFSHFLSKGLDPHHLVKSAPHPRYATRWKKSGVHQLISSLSHYLQGFMHPRWCRISSINSIKRNIWVGEISQFRQNFIFDGSFTWRIIPGLVSVVFITMVGSFLSPKYSGLWAPFQMAFLWLINGGY